MRDNADGMLELIKAEKVDGHFFAVIKCERNGMYETFRFGVSERSYGALKRILQTRPFDSLPGLQHRYFMGYSGSVRIEIENDGKEFKFEAPPDLINNFRWFFGLKDLSEAAHLRGFDEEKGSRD